MIIQLCGLSGAGKTTLARSVSEKVRKAGLPVEIIDGDEYRETLCRGLTFSKSDRSENMRRLAFVASKLSAYGIISIICAINPFDEVRREIHSTYNNVKTIYIDCPLEVLVQRDTKGLYRKAFLPDNDPEKITNLTGVNDPFDIPVNPDLHISTKYESITASTDRIAHFIFLHSMKLVPLRPNLPAYSFQQRMLL